ncbi:cell division protein ZapE [Halomonas sp. V046]|uniref:cell division protein ZapE n=1 Tax=Halomonas sp. V046 TaxID=3459611 RepID=UPI004043D8CB
MTVSVSESASSHPQSEPHESPGEAYRRALAEGVLLEDAAQRQAVDALEGCHRALVDGSRPNGVYLWGKVGRGKTWLMDLFAAGCPVPARRLHFHHFMRWVHRRQFQLGGGADPLNRLADELVGEVRVLCLDELYVEDIADAMLLGGLLERLFVRGLVVLTTSNQPPSELYRDGFNRERFMPAIAAMEQHMQTVHLGGDLDHREHPGVSRQRYFVRRSGEPSVVPELFRRLAPAGIVDTALTLGARTIAVRGLGAKVIWCDFADLCEAPLSTLDFIGLCDRFDTLLLDGVPGLAGESQPARIARGTEDAYQRVVAGDRELPPLAPRDDSVRRFIALVDECYDRGVPLVIEAEVAMEALYPNGYLAFAFRRTLSRLREMQWERFGRRPGV